MTIKVLNYQLYRLSSIFIVLLNFISIYIRNKNLNFDKNTCNNSLLRNARDTGFDFNTDNIIPVYESIFPEIFNFKLFSHKCFGSVVSIVEEDYFTNFYFTSNQYLFIVFFIIFNILIIYFLLYENRNFNFYLRFLVVFFTIWNFFNFEFYYLNFVFQIIFYYSLVLILYNGVMSNEVSSKKIKDQNLFIYLSFWVLTITLEHFKLIFYKSEFYHFKLWITNYLQGYNRRGLIGQIIFYSGEFIDLRYVVLGLFTLILSFLAYFIYKIFIGKNQNYISYFLLLSPSFINFQILDIRGSMRKEVLGLLSFVMVVHFINKGKSLTVPLFIFILSIFSHPANLFILPFLIGYMYKNKINKKFKILFVIPGLIYLSSGIFFTPSNNFDSLLFCEQTNQLINTTVDCKLLDSGDLAGTVNSDIYDYLNLTERTVGKKYMMFYIASFLVSLIPFIFLKDFLLKNMYLVFLLLPYLLLFLVAFDWGRWISLYISILTIIYLNYDSKIKSSNYKLSFFLFFILYSFFWKMPHCCIDTGLPFLSPKAILTELPIYIFTELYFSELFTFN